MANASDVSNIGYPLHDHWDVSSRLVCNHALEASDHVGR